MSRVLVNKARSCPFVCRISIKGQHTLLRKSFSLHLHHNHVDNRRVNCCGSWAVILCKLLTRNHQRYLPIPTGRLLWSEISQFLAKLGPQSPHLYRMLELADPNADAIWFEGRTWNYRAMKQQVDELALGFHELGVKNGDIVAVFMANSPEMAFTVLHSPNWARHLH